MCVCMYTYMHVMIYTYTYTGAWNKGLEDVDETEWMHYQLTAGESIGDIDLLYASKRRRFTVKAIKHSTVLELSQEVCHSQ